MSIPTNSDDVIDSRDIIERINELQDAIVADLGSAPRVNSALVAELATLMRFADEASGYSEDWTYGSTIINDAYFTSYAKELAEDLGYLNSPCSNSWPYTCIDWGQAARELQQDYTAVTFDGVTYWVR